MVRNCDILCQWSIIYFTTTSWTTVFYLMGDISQCRFTIELIKGDWRHHQVSVNGTLSFSAVNVIDCNEVDVATVMSPIGFWSLLKSQVWPYGSCHLDCWSQKWPYLDELYLTENLWTPDLLPIFLNVDHNLENGHHTTWNWDDELIRNFTEVNNQVRSRVTFSYSSSKTDYFFYYLLGLTYSDGGGCVHIKQQAVEI